MPRIPAPRVVPRSRASVRACLRATVLVHRYLGIGLGIVMALWCLSGIVMLYLPYPQLAEPVRLAALPPISWHYCCTVERPATLPPDTKVSRFQLEMFGDTPTLQLELADGAFRLVDLTNGKTFSALDREGARMAAARFGTSRELSLRDARYALIDHDQWTVGGFQRDRPLHWFAFGDSAGTEVYVSSRTGKVVQLTTASQRFWSWMGAVPHWLYLSVLRQHPEAWSQVVIWTSLLGTFLTATGLIIGISHLRRRRSDGKLASPYRGIMYWHHVPGLVFGVFALTWVMSGLLSMNPWGLMETGGIGEDFGNLKGASPTLAQVETLINSVPSNSPRGVVSVRSVPLDGKLFAVSTAADGTQRRFAMDGTPAQLTREEINAAAHRLTGSTNAVVETITAEDSYHYSVGNQVAQLPAVRITSGAQLPVYHYLDAVTGELINKADAGGKAYRWWHSGLHRWDFVPALRTSMARNLLLLPLLLGAAFVSVIGAYVGIRRLLPKRPKRIDPAPSR